MGIDEKIDVLFKPVADAVSNVVFFSIPFSPDVQVKVILIWLAAAAVFFTFYLGFVNFRYFFHAIDVVRGKFDVKEDRGQINNFQALAASISGTVGLGNIAGVAVAVSVGGPGAVFWMIVMGFLGMSSKFAEVTLGVKYRKHMDPKNPEEISGGPMYYLQAAFDQRKIPYLGRIMGVFFAVCVIAGAIGGGNMFQANQTYYQLYLVTGGEAGILAGKGWLFGLALAFLVGIVIIGGIKSIANVSTRLVPLMCITYLVAGLVVLGYHYQNIPGALMTILHDAFSMEAGIGGLMGGLLVGVQRASFSNEAGLGSAAIVHAPAKTDTAIKQGMVGMLGPFIDTVVICTMTALMIVVSGAHLDGTGVEGVELTSRAMASAVSWFPYVLAFTVFLFAYSTLITWAYYGQKGLTYIFGEKPWLEMAYKIFFCGCVVIGTSANFDNIVSFTDAMILSLAFPNIVGLYMLAPEIKRDLKDYIAKLKKQR